MKYRRVRIRRATFDEHYRMPPLMPVRHGMGNQSAQAAKPKFGDTIYCVQYRRGFASYLWFCGFREWTSNLFKWQDWYDSTTGASSCATYEEALVCAQNCHEWLSLQIRDPKVEVYEWAPNQQLDLHE